MKKLLFLCLLCLCSCSAMTYKAFKTTKCTPEFAILIDSIPYMSSKIVMPFKYSQDVCFDSTYKRFLKNSYQVENENKNVGAIMGSTSYGDNSVRINAICDNGKLSLTGDFKSGSSSTNAMSFILGVPMTSSWTTAYWNQDGYKTYIDNPSLVFAKILSMFRTLSKSDKDIVFIKK